MFPTSTITPAAPPEPAAPPVVEEEYPLIDEDTAIRLNTLGLLDLRRGRGELAAFRGEWVIAAPDGSILAHHPRLKDAEAAALPEATARGIPISQLANDYVPTLDD